MGKQFLSLPFDFIRGKNFRKLSPSALKVYIYLKSFVLRDTKSKFFCENKLVCRVSRKKIQEATGLSAYQVGKTICELKTHGIKIIRTGRASFFVLGEWKTGKNSNQPVEKFWIEG